MYRTKMSGSHITQTKMLDLQNGGDFYDWLREHAVRGRTEIAYQYYEQEYVLALVRSDMLPYALDMPYVAAGLINRAHFLIYGPYRRILARGSLQAMWKAYADHELTQPTEGPTWVYVLFENHRIIKQWDMPKMILGISHSKELRLP